MQPEIVWCTPLIALQPIGEIATRSPPQDALLAAVRISLVWNDGFSPLAGRYDGGRRSGLPKHDDKIALIAL